MPSEGEEIVAVRKEIVSLLRQQMEALDAPAGLTDTTLMECYERQARVEELREKLQTASNAVSSKERRDHSSLADAIVPAQVEHGVVGSLDGSASL